MTEQAIIASEVGSSKVLAAPKVKLLKVCLAACVPNRHSTALASRMCLHACLDYLDFDLSQTGLYQQKAAQHT